jgi:hypothetical protein
MKSVIEFMHSIERSAVGIAVSQSPYGFSALDMLHIAAISVVFGMIAMLDLRLIGVALRNHPVTELSRQVLPWTWGAFVLSVITGVLMFTGQAAKYTVNFAFLVKLGVLALAAANMLAFHFITYRGVAKWDRDAAVPLAGKIAGAISLLCWIAVVCYGRFTAYYMF